MRINLKKPLAFPRAFAGGRVLAFLPCFLIINTAQAGWNLNGGLQCSLDSQNFVSVTIGNLAKAPPITVPVNMTCTLSPGMADPYLKQPDKWGVAYCWHYHNLPLQFQYRTVGPTGFDPNVPKAPYINYNFYGVSNGLKVGGYGDVSQGQYNMIGWAKGSGYQYHMSDAVTMKFENNQGIKQKPGVYNITSTVSFHGGMSAMPLNMTINENIPDRWCRSGDPDAVPIKTNDITVYPQVVYTPKVMVKVQTYCNTSIKNQATFPAYASLQNVKPITATLNVDCSAGTHYRVDSNMGLHAIGNQRYMKGKNSDATIAYNIDSINSSSGTYTPDPAAPLQKWTDYGNGTPAGINYDIQLSIPRQPTPIDDTYTDTIIYTVNHIPEEGDITDLNNMAGYTVQ